MKHYIDRTTNEIFAYEADGSQDEYIRADLELLTEEELVTARDAQKPSIEVLNEIADAQRLAAYAVEADPLFFKYQRKEVTKKVWTDKIAEIKSRFPKTEE
jgi:hypothetical protein